jgi:hypothetical protein
MIVLIFRVKQKMKRVKHSEMCSNTFNHKGPLTMLMTVTTTYQGYLP